MPNELFRREFISRVKIQLQRAKSAGLLDHPGLIGRAREIFVKEFLKPILPAYVEIGSGKIADSKGQLSDEIDIIVYSAKTLPPLLYEMGFGIFPAEACIYAIEVKSTLTAEKLKETIEKYRKFKQIFYLPSALSKFYKTIGPPSVPVIPTIFAFSSDLTEGGKGELERYRELDFDADINPIIPVMCVAGRGYWWYKPSEPAEKWISHLPSESNDEIIDFLGGIANTIPDQIILKGQPRFGCYIIEPHEFRKL